MSKAKIGAACLVAGGLGAVATAVVVLPRAAAAPPAAEPHVLAATPEQAGRHIVRIAGCNDCHTPGFDRQGEKVPEAQWLVGVPLGFKGPWGTSYPANLRTKVQAMNEDTWVTFLKNYTGRPPMPWPSVHAMGDADLRSLYRYIRSLGPSDNAVPEGLPPGQPPATPYVAFEPVMPAGK